LEDAEYGMVSKLVYLAKNTNGKRKALRSMNCGPTIEKHR
jgi:hypothetical protein